MIMKKVFVSIYVRNGVGRGAFRAGRRGEWFKKADRDGLTKGAVLARAARAYNPDYGVFTIPYKYSQST
jgi:hypothetical protein